MEEIQKELNDLTECINLNKVSIKKDKGDIIYWDNWYTFFKIYVLNNDFDVEKADSYIIRAKNKGLLGGSKDNYIPYYNEDVNSNNL